TGPRGQPRPVPRPRLPARRRLGRGLLRPVRRPRRRALTRGARAGPRRDHGGEPPGRAPLGDPLALSPRHPPADADSAPPARLPPAPEPVRRRYRPAPAIGLLSPPPAQSGGGLEADLPHAICPPRRDDRLHEGRRPLDRPQYAARPSARAEPDVPVALGRVRCPVQGACCARVRHALAPLPLLPFVRPRLAGSALG